jgi:hypothetical protein
MNPRGGVVRGLLCGKKWSRGAAPAPTNQGLDQDCKQTIDQQGVANSQEVHGETRHDASERSAAAAFIVFVIAISQSVTEARETERLILGLVHGECR